MSGLFFMQEEKNHTYGFPKSERLTGKLVIDRLYKNGTSIKKFPVKLIFIRLEEPSGEALQCVMSVPKRIHKRAVDRNAVKRQMREVYRHVKHDSIKKIKDLNQSYAIMFVYLGKNIDEYESMESSMVSCLKIFNEKVDEEIRS